MATEFEVNGKLYRVGKLDAIKQLHLARKIGPIVAKIAPQFIGVANSERPQPNGDNQIEAEAEIPQEGPVPLPGATSLTDTIKLIEPVLDALADMKDEDVNYITRLCLSVTKRQEGPNAWMSPWNANAGRFQFDDIDMNVLVQICLNVIQENIGGFLAANPLSSGVPGAPMPATLN